MWHVSVRHPRSEEAVKLAFEALHGVGDSKLGQWTEWHTAFHLRRRLHPEEQKLVGDVLDVRGSAEAWRRFKELPAAVRKLVGEPL